MLKKKKRNDKKKNQAAKKHTVCFSAENAHSDEPVPATQVRKLKQNQTPPGLLWIIGKHTKIPPVPADSKDRAQKSPVHDRAILRFQLGLTTPVAGDPVVATTLMCPVTRYPCPTRMRRQGPVTTDSHIMSSTGFPFFADPHVPGAGSHRTMSHRMPGRTYTNINLRRNLVRNRTCCDHDHNKKCQLYNFTFTHLHFFRGVRNYCVIHMLVFKFLSLKVSNTES